MIVRRSGFPRSSEKWTLRPKIGVMPDPVAMQSITRSDERILSADIFSRDAKVPRADLGMHHEPGREIPVYRDC